MVDRKAIINAYGEKAMNRIANDLGVQLKGKEGLCPFHTEKTPSFTFNPKTFTFHCFGCGENYDIINHLMEYEQMTFLEAIESICKEIGIDSGIEDCSQERRIEKVKYKKPTVITKPLDGEILVHLAERGLERKTLEHWRVKTGVNSFKYIVEGEKKYIKKKCMVFECYDEYNELIHASYRTSDKHFSQSIDTKTIVWGLWHLDFSKTLYVTEGQIDAMTLWQCGFKNVISIPAGASNWQFLENNYNVLSKFEEIIYWIDGDDPGMKAGAKFKEKFENTRLVRHRECKDANETMTKLGIEEIQRFLKETPPLPEGIKDISDVAYSTEECGEEDRIETGFKEYDEHIADWRMQQLSIVFGRDNEGKSTFISQVITHQLEQGKKTFLFSAELGDQAIQTWLYRQLIGQNKNCYTMIKGKYKTRFLIKEPVLKSIRKYTRDKLYIVDSKNDAICESNDVLFKSFKRLATKFGVRLFILDNLQAVMIQKYNDINRDQSNFVERCRRFAKNYNVHVVLVAHPHKVMELEATEDTVIGNLKKDDISGSKDISNKAHNIISIERDFTREYFDMILTNLKDKEEGVRKGFKYRFDTNTSTFYSDATKLKMNEKLQLLVPKDIEYYNGEK